MFNFTQNIEFSLFRHHSFKDFLNLTLLEYSVQIIVNDSPFCYFWSTIVA